MLLTLEQKELLKRSSSGLTGEQFDRLSKEEADIYVDRLNEAIKSIQAQNPSAFIFEYAKNKQVDIVTECKKRKFYDAPAGKGSYASAEKYRIRYPKAHNISTGVK